MEIEASLVDRMQALGLRMTWQRRILAQLLEKADEHLDAEHIYERARQMDSRIHRATVYRTLNTLKKHGLIDELDLMRFGGDRHYYEIRPKTFHIHLVCMRCGLVDEPGGPFWDDLKNRVRRETSFLPEVVRLEMGGLCVRCQSSRSTGSTG